MKRLKIIIALLSFGFIGLNAQTLYDGELFTQRDLTGTARYVGMGGALGALGADISTMSTNPAGIGLYRSYDFSTTFGYSFNEVKSNFEGSKHTADKNKFGMKTMGFVISNYLGDSGLKYLNFGFNYVRAKDFYRNTKVQGVYKPAPDGNISLTHIMDLQANGLLDGGVDIAEVIESNDPFYADPNIGWLGALGYDGRLIKTASDNNGNPYYFSYLPQADAETRVNERGGINQYDFNISGNVSDRFFFGLTIGAYDLNYRSYTYYDEDYGNNMYSVLHTNREIDGSGFDFKFGAIVRPIEDSPFRVGVAIHTPTYFKLTNYTHALLETYVGEEDENGSLILPDKSTIVSPNDELNGRSDAYDFELNTPWKFNFSLGHNVGEFLALGAEYEYQDYGSMKFKEDGGYNGVNSYSNLLNNQRDMLKAVHTLKLGAEYRIVPEFAFRLGYNIQSASFKDSGRKEFPLNSTMTDIHFTNNNDMRNTFTFGLGYMGKMFYSDLAFKFDWYKSEFKPFDDEELAFTKLTTNRSQILFTLGMRL